MEKEPDKNEVKQLFIKELNDVINTEINTKSRIDFTEAIKDLKPAKCEVKIGWLAGKYISFTCKFTKNGKGSVIDEIVKAIPDDKQTPYFYFIAGLKAEIFHFNPKYKMEDNDFVYLNFKLKRNERIS